MRARDEQKENAIRHEAMKAVVQKGLDGLSMQKLAVAANVSPATIYIYFKDREDLIMQLCITESERMVTATLKDFDPEMPFGKGLKLQWKNRLNYWMKNPLEAQFLELVRNSQYGEKVSKMTKREFSAAMRKFVLGAIERKEMISLPAEVYWSIAFSPLYTLIRFHISGKGFHPEKKYKLDDAQVNKAFSLVLKALTP
ncbi:MAG: TetR/AcrR family transcriptional regulator [Bacteroidia bacterium]